MSIDENDPAWSWNNFSMSKHTSTHFDAPKHWGTGKDVVNGNVDTMATKDLLLEWEKANGQIEAGSRVFMRTDWGKVTDLNNHINMQGDSVRSTGFGTEAVLWMIEERDAFDFGTECIGTNAGQAHTFEPQYPCHHYMYGADEYGPQCMTNLDLLPPKGAVIIASPLKIENGSGNPLHVTALVPS